MGRAAAHGAAGVRGYPPEKGVGRNEVRPRGKAFPP